MTLEMHLFRLLTFAVSACGLFLMAAGARAMTVETICWQDRIDAVSQKGGGRVTIPPGRHIVGQLNLRSNVELHLSDGAVLCGSTDLRHYSPVRPKCSEGDLWAIVMAVGVTNVSVTGFGKINGEGWRWKNYGHGVPSEGLRPRGLVFLDCKGVRLADFSLIDAACWGCVLHRCDGVVARNVKIDSHSNTNNDGFDIEASNVLIEECDVDSGDDAYVIKSNDHDFVVENVTIRKCVGRSTSNVFKIGTASHGIVRNIVFENCRSEASRRSFAGPDGGEWFQDYRMRSWPGATTNLAAFSGFAVECVDGGVVSNVVGRKLDLNGVLVPFFIRGGARRGRSCGIPPNDKYVLSDVRIEDVVATAESYVASSITGVRKCRPRAVSLTNVLVDCKGAGPLSKSVSADVPEEEGAYPESCMFHSILPAYGLYVRHAEDVKFSNVKFRLQDGTTDCRVAIAEIK